MLNSHGLTVKYGYSPQSDEKKAVEELSAQIYQPDASLTAIFASSRYNLSILGPLIENRFGDNVIGCTTAGEITQTGYKTGTICGFSISGAFKAYPFFIQDLQNRCNEEIDWITQKILDILPQNTLLGYSPFAISLIDGLSMMEEHFLFLLGNRLGQIPVAGGSAGDDQQYISTFVYHKGRFQTNCATYCLCATPVPFKVIKTQHFISTEQRLIITKADPDKRLIYEINGNPASIEYARILGIKVSDLNLTHFFNNPLLLRLNDKFYVHSIKKSNDDCSLAFFSAVEEGLVLRVAAKSDIVENLKNSLQRASNEIGKISLTIGFECILRKLEIETCGQAAIIEDLLQKYNTVGFCTYGEQYIASHVNQTFTAITLGMI